MNQNAWGEREEKIQEVFLKGEFVQKLRNVTEIEIYQHYLGLDIFQEFTIDKFYSPLKNRYYPNIQLNEKIDSLYQQPKVRHQATLLLARDSEQISNIRIKEIQVAGLYQGDTNYLVGNEEEQDGRIQPHGYRLDDIVMYQPIWDLEE
jgi:hypothetical protein